MILDEESAGDDGAPGKVQRADFKIEDVLAAAALKVIVMAEPGALIAGLSIGENDSPDAIGFQQQIERPVNRGDAEAAERALGASEDLLYRDGPPGLGDGLEDGIALTGMTLAERG